MWLPTAPILTQQYQLQKVVKGADLRSTGMCPGALPFPATHQTALMTVVCASSLWFYRSPLEYFRAQKILTTYCSQAIVSASVRATCSGRTNQRVLEMLRDTGRTPKVLPSLPPPPPSPHKHGREIWSRAVAPGNGKVNWSGSASRFPLSRVQSQVSAKFTGGRTEEAVMRKILCY